MAEIEKAHEIWYPRSKTRFEKSEEESRGHHAGERECGCLTGGGDAPADDTKGGPNVRGDDLPHYREPFKDDVGDVEDCEEPLVLGRGEIEVYVQMGDFCISGGRISWLIFKREGGN